MTSVTVAMPLLVPFAVVLLVLGLTLRLGQDPEDRYNLAFFTGLVVCCVMGWDLYHGFLASGVAVVIAKAI